MHPDGTDGRGRGGTGARRLAVVVGAGVDVDRMTLAATLRRLGDRRGWAVDGAAPPDPAAPADAVLHLVGPGDPVPPWGPGAPALVVPMTGPDAHGLAALPLVLDGLLAGVETPPDRTVALDDPARPAAPDEERRLAVHAPAGPPAGVALLVHGGYWRSRWTPALMTRLAADLAGRGWCAAVLGYRRPDRHGWDATVDDVRAGVVAAAALAPGRPLVLVGHSAGGQLALQAAESVPGVALAVSLAGVVDLDAAAHRRLSEGAARAALGDPAEHLARYDAASPARFPRRGVPWLLVQGTDDDPDLVEMNRRLAAREDLGRPALVEGPGDHFAVVDPASGLWRAAAARLAELVEPGADRSGTEKPRRRGRP